MTTPRPPATHWWAASNSGPTASPATLLDHASGSGPSSRAVGARRAMRRSDP